jgi:signal transduction histidine kinase
VHPTRIQLTPPGALWIWCREIQALICRLIAGATLVFVFLCPGFLAEGKDVVATDHTDLLIDGMEVDHSSLKAEAYGVDGKMPTQNLPPGAHRLQLTFHLTKQLENQSVRLRYRLEGLDSAWQEAGGEMRTTVLFETANSQTISTADFPVHGDSKGWKGSFENSNFTPHRERVLVPPNARFMQITIAGGGPPETVGLIAVKGLEIYAGEGTNGTRENLWPYTNPEFQKNADPLRDNPAGWRREGFPSRMAQVLPLSGGGWALAVVDNSGTGYAEWVSQIDLHFQVHPGQALDLEWQEMYSVGSDAGESVDYTYVPPGKYTFRVKAVTPLGGETGQETALALVIPQYFWERPWFVIMTFVLSGAMLVFIVRHFVHRRWQFKLERLRYQNAVQLERERIARDIHDDLGGNLTQIAMLSELAQADLQRPDSARKWLDKIFNTATILARQLDETVWAINPAQDSLESIVAFLGNFAQEHFRLAGIRCRFDVPDPLPNVVLTSTVRHNLFMAAKEALHNVAKHSGASEVWLRMRTQGEDLVFSIEDNGKGLPFRVGDLPTARMGGNGLDNIKRRVEDIGGRLEIESQPGQGTSIRLVLVRALNSPVKSKETAD